MKHEVDTLGAFSAALLELVDIAGHTTPDRMIDAALRVLRPLVPFSAAWWGECSLPDADLPRRSWLHGRINLSAAFAREWNALADGDAFAAASMQRLGVVVRQSGYADPVPEVEAFSRRHGLFHAMAITVELTGSGLMFFVALYRGADEPAFDDAQGALFAGFCAHLVHHWRMRVRSLLLGTHPRASDAFALVDANGTLLYLGGRLGRLLHRRHESWDGSTLPDDLAAQLPRAPCSIALGAQRLTLQPCGELVALTLERSGRAAALPPRERSVALLYAQGHTYKAIARLLGLSPATVRTYLRSVYLQLGVRNKIELGGALARQRR